MVCPNCKNRDFEPSKEVKYPIKIFGTKQKYKTVNYRYYICMQCGYKWQTREIYNRPVKIRVKNKEIKNERGKNKTIPKGN